MPSSDDILNENLPLRRRRPPRPVSPNRESWITSFDDAQLPAPLLRGIYAYGMERPPPIVAQTLRDLVAGQSCHIVDAWGSGLVTAFCLGAACRIDMAALRLGRPQVVVVEPTREHAWNVFGLFKRLTEFIEPDAAVDPPQEVSRIIVGGEPVRPQFLALKSVAVAAIVGTPGRITDLVQRGALDLTDVRCVALDPMEDLDEKGFGDHIVELLHAVPPQSRVQLIAASLGKHPALLARVLPLFRLTVRDGASQRAEGSATGTSVMLQHVGRPPVVPAIDDYAHHVFAQPYVDADASEDGRVWAIADFLDRFASRYPAAPDGRPVAVHVRLSTRRWADALSETLLAMGPIPEERATSPPEVSAARQRPARSVEGRGGGGSRGSASAVPHRDGVVSFTLTGRSQWAPRAQRGSVVCETVIAVVNDGDPHPVAAYLEVLGGHTEWIPGGSIPQCRRVVTVVLFPRDSTTAEDGADLVAGRWIARVSADLRAAAQPALAAADDDAPWWPFSRFVWGRALPPE